MYLIALHVEQCSVSGWSVIKWHSTCVMLASKPKLIMQVCQTHNVTTFSCDGSEKMTVRLAVFAIINSSGADLGFAKGGRIGSGSRTPLESRGGDPGGGPLSDSRLLLAATTSPNIWSLGVTPVCPCLVCNICGGPLTLLC